MEDGYAIFRGWKKMCTLSKGAGNCQSVAYCDDATPCLPHWKVNDDLTAALETGPASDGDEDAIVGMIMLTLAAETDRNAWAWYNEVAEWSYSTCVQHYESNFIDSQDKQHRILKLGACWYINTTTAITTTTAVASCPHLTSASAMYPQGRLGL